MRERRRQLGGIVRRPPGRPHSGNQCGVHRHHGTGHVGGNGATGLAAVIQEAVTLREVLADAKARTHRLIGALRRHRKQSKLLTSTLQSLKQLRLQEAAE